MARTTPAKKAWRSLAWLAVIIVALVGLNAYGAIFQKDELVPKLALDLEGGTQIILQPELASGQQVTSDQLTQAVAIIRERIDAAGVSESEINTQGSNGNEQVVVSIPGTLDEQTKSRITKAAKLTFRAVLVTDAASSSTSNSASPSASPSATPAPQSTPSTKPTNASDLAYVTPALQQQFATYDCKSTAAANANLAPDNQPLIACDADGVYKYILGPVEVSGTDITNASSSQVVTSQGATTGQWAVNITFSGNGGTKFEAVSTRLIGLESPRNQFAVVLDGRVITAPVVQGVTKAPQITGSFTQQSSKTLADQLKFGALPINFTTQSVDQISATLGTSSLLSGLLAGLIGLILVVLYSLLQYRVLAIVTVGSLVIAAIITYLFVTYLSWQQGYRLSLAGVAGLIVAIGITADSFIVYFERIRDELRDGRALESAVEAGWKRAIRTVLASDTVNFLAALVLFLLAVGNVRGFALTLGLTTIIDVIVVSLFTHPVMQLIARTRFFSEGHRFSGLDPNALGAVYRGRAQFRSPAVATGKTAGASREAQRRQTIAERKAADAEAKRAAGKDS
ncbi:protein translocase subunit SecD [Galbitalea soli]|uniref:Protein translocase subunit SecD n=1 Tax=Galbitalea soli TaxID=1268042 RepID=A0A7C9PLF9_9MICO|nr:protein translocase subunit SecD [Galbitalea soli]NYJ30941.1 preprotein translocase subunit SecD [Galbitalea soli]